MGSKAAARRPRTWPPPGRPQCRVAPGSMSRTPGAPARQSRRTPGVLCGPGGIPGESGRRDQSAAQVTQLSALGAGLGLLQLTCHSRGRLESRVHPLLRRRKCRFEPTHLSYHQSSSIASLHTRAGGYLKLRRRRMVLAFVLDARPKHVLSASTALPCSSSVKANYGNPLTSSMRTVNGEGRGEFVAGMAAPGVAGSAPRVGGRRVPIRDGNPARPGCRDFDVRSPLLTCAECYRAAPTTRGRSIELGSGHHASPVRRLSDATE